MARRWGLQLPVERTRDRLAAYVYGNILVLSAVATVSPASAADGRGALVVLATTVTTYLAHIVSFFVGASVGREEGDTEAHGEVKHELRDALPIIASGSLPVLVLAVTWWSGLDPDLGVLLASLVVILRLAGLGLVVGRLSGRAPSRRQAVGGLLVALVCGVVVALKVVLLH